MPRKQGLAIAALLEAPTIRETAQAAEVGEVRVLTMGDHLLTIIIDIREQNPLPFSLTRAGQAPQARGMVENCSETAGQKVIFGNQKPAETGIGSGKVKGE